jgi:hypothetical protein
VLRMAPRDRFDILMCDRAFVNISTLPRHATAGAMDLNRGV